MIKSPKITNVPYLSIYLMARYAIDHMIGSEDDEITIDQFNHPANLEG